MLLMLFTEKLVSWETGPASHKVDGMSLVQCGSMSGLHTVVSLL